MAGMPKRMEILWPNALVGQKANLLQLGRGEQVGLVDGQNDPAVALGLLGGQSLQMSDQNWLREARPLPSRRTTSSQGNFWSENGG